MGKGENEFHPLQEAVAFAARAHRNQLRKDKETPYVSHVFRVCLILRDLFGIDDRQALTAAILHDTVEDTATDFDDLEEMFGKEVAGWVAALSKDTRLPEVEREAAYVEQLKSAPWQVKLCKLADIYDNLTDLGTNDPRKWVKTFKNAHRYLDALKSDLPRQAHQPYALVTGLLETLEAQETGRAGGA